MTCHPCKATEHVRQIDAISHEATDLDEGASAACHAGITNPTLDNAHIAEATAEAALKAYATVAVAYRRASGVYAIDEEMQKLGTAAVHLLTMATSHMKAHPDGDAS